MVNTYLGFGCGGGLLFLLSLQVSKALELGLVLLLLSGDPFSLGILFSLHDTGPLHRSLALCLLFLDPLLFLPISFCLGRYLRRLALPLKPFGCQSLILRLNSSQLLQSLTLCALFLRLFGGSKAELLFAACFGCFHIGNQFFLRKASFFGNAPGLRLHCGLGGGSL